MRPGSASTCSKTQCVRDPTSLTRRGSSGTMRTVHQPMTSHSFHARRRLLAALLVLPTGASLSLSAMAADYPTRAIKFICTSAAGSPLDAMMRQLAKQVGDELKQSVIVENHAGGSGAVGMSLTKNQPADGYTIVSATGTTSFM